MPPGGDAEALAPLSLDLLNPDDDLANALTRFGLCRVSDLLRLPERALIQRLGARIVPLLELARGHDRSPPPPAETTTCFEEAQELEFPAHQLEPLLFVLNGMLSRLLERLTCRGLALGDLDAHVVQLRHQARDRHLALVVAGQHGAAQRRPEVTLHPVRQRRQHGPAVGRAPALAPEADDTRANQQVLHHERLVALEPRTGRNLSPEHALLMDAEPRRLAALGTALAPATA